jgi:radical SAM protein with 4Fe4S-binding SPASM domain
MPDVTDTELCPAEFLGEDRPSRSLSMPWQINVALTTRCPLNCPQCYVKADEARDIDWAVLAAYVAEAAALKMHELNLSGGEPLSYPRLAEAVRLATAAGLGTAVATSGVGLTAALAKELAASGLGSLWLSLNGSREEIHALSRTCFRETLTAAALLKSLGLPFYINWVARQDNAGDFPALAAKARDLGAKGIVVLVLKPDSRHNAGAVLTGEAFFRLAAFLRDYDDPAMPIEVESCYSAMRLAVHGEWTTGIEAGCSAGRDTVAIDVAGRLRPCPHLDSAEAGVTIAEYWRRSPALAALRATEETIGAPCRGCGHLPFCRPCRAKAAKVYGDPAAGDRQCPVALREMTRHLFR